MAIGSLAETGWRILSGLALAAFALAALALDYGDSLLALGLVAAVALLGLHEFYRLTDRGRQGRPFQGIGLLFGALIVLTYYLHFLYLKQLLGYDIADWYRGIVGWFASARSFAIPLLLLLFISASAAQIFTRSLEGAAYSIAVTILGPIYTVVTICHLFLILALPGGIFYVILLLIIPISMDAGAYFSGRALGRHRLGIQASPNKTCEGYIGGAFVAILISQAYLYGWEKWGEMPAGESLAGPAGLAGEALPSFIEMAFIAAFISGLSVIADLAESVLKRDANKKDSASLIPGHGGILDLMDAMLWSLPVGYYYLILRGYLVDPLY